MVQIAIFTSVMQSKLEEYVNNFIKKNSSATPLDVIDVKFSHDRHGEINAMILYKIEKGNNMIMICNKKYKVIKKLSPHAFYGEHNECNNLNRFLLEDEKDNKFVLLTDNDLVFHLYDEKETCIVLSGCYNKINWGGELNEKTWL